MNLPRLLYRWRLGWVVGHRFLLVVHRGRKTGRPRQTVLEVAHYDPQTHECVVAAAYGSQSDWYQNIHAQPALPVPGGRERYTPAQRDLTPEETFFVLRDYQRRYRWAFRQLMSRLYSYDGTEMGLRELAQRMPAVAFRPARDHASTVDQKQGPAGRSVEEHTGSDPAETRERPGAEE